MPLFKLRTGDEDPSMQVDNAEDEEKPQEASTNITLAETERALRKGGAQYAKGNAQRFYEERLANQAKVENFTARYDQVLQLVERQEEQLSQATNRKQIRRR